MAIQVSAVHPIRVLGAVLLCGALAACNGQSSSAGAGVATLSGTPAATVTANSAYYFRPQAENPPGSSLLFSIENKPAWASFSLTTGQLSGTPSSADTGDYPGIQITATDGTSSATLPPFTIHVRPPSALVASNGSTGSTSSTTGSGGASGTTTSSAGSGAGSTSTSTGGTSSGSTSSSTSGTSSGSTGSTSTGTGGTSGSTSTGTSGSSTSGDTISVSWLAPTENTDGSALTNLAGYTIYYGSTASAMTQKVSINTVGELSYVLSNLAPGTWYVEVVAVNSAGVQSAPSSMVSITL